MSDRGGIKVGLFGMLGILFIGLRLANVIDWEWWVVLMPVWAPLAFVAFLLLAMVAYNAWDRWRWRR